LIYGLGLKCEKWPDVSLQDFWLVRSDGLMQVNSPIDQCSKSLVGQDWDLQFVDYDHQQKWGSITYNPPRTNHHQGFGSHPLETAV